LVDTYQASVGLLVPAGNRIIERDLRRELAPQVAYHVGRLPRNRTTVEELEAMLASAVAEAPEVAAAGIDLLVFACTTGSLVGGPAYDSKVIAAISEAAGGAVATTTTTEVLKALRETGASSVSVFTPYASAVNARVDAFLSREGFNVRELHGLGLVAVDEICSVEPSAIAEWVASERSFDTDAVFISCTAFRGVEAAELLADVDVPVITSNGATIAGIHDRIGVTVTRQT
jgi:maleate isomerase